MPLERRAHVERRPRIMPAGRLCVVFRVGAVRYAIEACHVRRAGRAADGPGSCPVVDLGSLFALPGRRDEGAAILIVEGAHATVGVRVDEIINLARVEESAIVRLPEIFDGIERQWVEGLARFEGGILPLLDVAGLAARATTA